MIRHNGQYLDIPDAERGVHRFTSEDRADRAASFRLGHRQRQNLWGEVFWTHPFVIGLCFPTRKEAIEAALSRISTGKVA